MSNCISCSNDNLTDYPVCPTCAATCHFEHRKCLCETCKWIDYKTAAKLMHRPAIYLRERNADGVTYRYFPEIERWQPGGRRTKLYVRREHVEAWIERSRTPATAKPTFSGVGYQSLVPELRQLGADRLIRSLGLK